MINHWGSWEAFQKLLFTLDAIAEKHGVDLTNVATRWLLDRPAVGAVIIGARLGISDHSESNLKVFSFQLEAEDTEQLDAYALGERAEVVKKKLGDCGREYFDE